MNKGFTLIEIIVAIFVTVVGVVGIYSLVPHILKTSALNTDKFIAAQLAREGIEIMRNMRDSNFLYMLYEDFNAEWDSGLDDFFCTGLNGCQVDYTMLAGQDWTGGQPLIAPTNYGLNGQYLSIDNATGLYSYVGGVGTTPTKFKRRIRTTITDYGAFIDSRIKIVSEVSWPDQSFVVEDTIYNWR